MLNRHGMRKFCFAMTPELNIYTVTYLTCKKLVWFKYWWLASPKNWPAKQTGHNQKVIQ